MISESGSENVDAQWAAGVIRQARKLGQIDIEYGDTHTGTS